MQADVEELRVFIAGLAGADRKLDLRSRRHLARDEQRVVERLDRRFERPHLAPRSLSGRKAVGGSTTGVASVR
jgi:hypothetical protein